MLVSEALVRLAPHGDVNGCKCYKKGTGIRATVHRMTFKKGGGIFLRSWILMYCRKLTKSLVALSRRQNATWHILLSATT